MSWLTTYVSYLPSLNPPQLFVSEETTQSEILDAVSAVRAQFPDITPISTLILATPSASEETIQKFWPWLKVG